MAQVIWAVQMSTVEFHPWNSRRAHVEQPDEWRIDLDPMPEADFPAVRRVAHTAQEVLAELGITGYPKTSGGKGFHVYVRIEPEWGFGEVRRAALAFARESNGAAPTPPPSGGARTATPRRSSSTTTRTPATTPSPAPTRYAAPPTGTVSTPVFWDELDDLDPRDFTMASVPAQFADLATCTPASTTCRSGWTRCWSGPTETASNRPRTDLGPSGRLDVVSRGVGVFRRVARGMRSSVGVNRPRIACRQGP
ncbi:MAG: hypothetical protein R2719_05665 [Micropruina sp.]